jgi:hypothetical protein
VWVSQRNNSESCGAWTNATGIGFSCLDNSNGAWYFVWNNDSSQHKYNSVAGWPSEWKNGSEDYRCGHWASTGGVGLSCWSEKTNRFCYTFSGINNWTCSIKP